MTTAVVINKNGDIEEVTLKDDNIGFTLAILISEVSIAAIFTEVPL